MEDWHPTTDQELDQMQRRGKMVGTVLGTLYVVTAITGFAFGAFLQIQGWINFTSWHKPIRFFTEPPGTFLVFLALLFLLLKSLPLCRRVEAMRPYFRAADNYDRGRQAYDRWRKKHNKRDLTRSHHFLEGAAWCLKDVPEFAALWESVQEALEKPRPA